MDRARFLKLIGLTGAAAVAPELLKTSAVDAAPEVAAPVVPFATTRDACFSSCFSSGGLCAPVTPYYDLKFVSAVARPAKDALPAFKADRGGIRYQ